MPNILEVNHVCYSYHTLYGETEALKDITFSVKKGESVAIIGPSGCGKSTLFSIIAGLNQPESGSVIHLDERGRKASRVEYMLQKDHLFEWRSVYQNVILGLELHHELTDANLAKVDRLIKEYGLEMFRNKKPSELSGGMKQRAALIRTLALEPDLLLLDEPFSALDYQTRLSVSTDICSLIRKAGKTMLIITHDLSEAISLADRIIVLSNRPSTIKDELEIHLTISGDSPLAARNAPEFITYFNILWKEMCDEKNN